MERDALIAGLGLIGGSIGIALRSRGWRVRYLDPHVELDDARARGAADARVDSFEEAALTILATPVDVAVAQLPSVRGLATSVCSVMAPLRAAAHGRFVAGHPMAGSEARGLAAARGELFIGAKWFVDDDDPLVAQVVHDCGAQLVRVEAEEHDRAVAVTSHLPQVLSTALAAYLADQNLLDFAGSGLRTFLRLAGSDASVWKPVLAANRDPIAAHAAEVTRLVGEMLEGDPGEAFEKARAVMAKLKIEN
jgi:prephenate dehydrogenase